MGLDKTFHNFFIEYLQSYCTQQGLNEILKGLAEEHTIRLSAS